jgi:hypothetical protein
MSPHTVKAFDDDLDQLRATISEMGGLAEDAITESMRALVQRDTETAFRIMERDKRIDELEAEVEAAAVKLIALRAPMADDLREVIAALKISSMVERIGDYAMNIAKRVPVLEESNIEPLSLLPEMARIARRDGPQRARRLCRARPRQGGAGLRARPRGGRFLQFDFPDSPHPHDGESRTTSRRRRTSCSSPRTWSASVTTPQMSQKWSISQPQATTSPSVRAGRLHLSGRRSGR